MASSFLFFAKKAYTGTVLKEFLMDKYLLCLQMYPMAVYDFCQDKVKEFTLKAKKEADLVLKKDYQKLIEEYLLVQEDMRLLIVEANKKKDYI